MNRINDSRLQNGPRVPKRSPRSLQDGPEDLQDRLKTAQEPPRAAQKTPKTVPRGPKSAQERPKTPPRRSQDPSWDGLGAILGPSNNKIEIKIKNCQCWRFFRPDFGAQNAPPNHPKTTPKQVKNQDEKCITFLSLLDPSWTGLEAILGASWGKKSDFRIGFSNVS